MFYDKDDNGNKATIKYVSMNEIQKIMDKNEELKTQDLNEE